MNCFNYLRTNACFIRMVQEFVLGVYDADATAAFNQNLSDISLHKDPRSKDAYQRYHPHQYVNGTTCDLTNQPQETEVRFVCSEPRAMINSITEISTCKSAVTIQCPTLCKHPLFQAETVWQIINCNVLPKDYKETKVEEEESEIKQIVMVTDSELQWRKIALCFQLLRTQASCHLLYFLNLSPYPINLASCKYIFMFNFAYFG